MSAKGRRRPSLYELAGGDLVFDRLEFRSALMAYLEWDARIAMHDPSPDADVGTDLASSDRIYR